MSQILIRITTAFLVLICTSPTFGWGGDGHKIVGKIASNHLTPEAKAGVRELLGKRTLAEVSVWADMIKSDPSYRWASPLHYANVRRGAEAFSLSRDCPKQGCIVSAILRYTKVLRSKTASVAERTEALKFLVHFAGDIHQPLHVSHRRDKGGNRIKVKFFTRGMNLHSVWDGGILGRAMKEMKWHQYANKLLRKMSSDDMEAWSKITDPSDWATESYKLALSNAYAIPESRMLGKTYFKRNIPVVDQRLQMGGVRLAVLLNSVFPEE